MYVILDTQSIHHDFGLSKPATADLLAHAAERGLTVCIPEVVILEMLQDFREELVKALEGLGRAPEDIRRLLVTTGKVNPTIDVQAQVSDYEVRLRRRLSETGVLVLPLPTVDLGELLRRSIERRKPFKRDGQGVGDAVIWASVVQLCRESPGEQVAVITGDRDYADTTGERLHPDLLEDLGSMALDAQVVTASIESVESVEVTPAETTIELHKSVQAFSVDWRKRTESISTGSQSP